MWTYGYPPGYLSMSAVVVDLLRFSFSFVLYVSGALWFRRGESVALALLALDSTSSSV